MARRLLSVRFPRSSISQYGPWFSCAVSSVVPLTYNRSRVEDGITAMTARGPTVIPEGLAWGWRVLSPTEPFTKVEAGPTQAATTISPYNDAKWQKIIVLMTDGENDVLSNGNQINSLNGSWYSAYGRGRATSHNRFGTTTTSNWNPALTTNMQTLCTNIKAQNITHLYGGLPRQLVDNSQQPEDLRHVRGPLQLRRRRRRPGADLQPHR